ncbi:MAG: alpha-L-glutamate ligase-like protein [Candidatus Abyssubacteria bacterium]
MNSLLRRIEKLRTQILGINSRNLDYIYPLNPRQNYPRADDKLLTKGILSARGLPVPRTLAVFQNALDLRRLEAVVQLLDRFALKPAMSTRGRGIMIVRRDESGRLVTNGKVGAAGLDMEDLRSHIVDILAGVFSLERGYDKAFFEELVEPEETLGSISKGLPDIRIVVYKNQPKMAMVRIPTRVSGGRANLHQGALGLGVDLRTGCTTFAVHGNRNVSHHPDTGAPLRVLQIPMWNEILRISEEASDCCGLGYIGVDVVIDKSLRALIMEVNARPGLNIQLANRQGLAKLLRGAESA